MTFKLTLLTPEGVVFDDDVTGFVAPGVNGLFGVLARHAPMVYALQSGVLKVQKDKAFLFFVLSDGFTEIAPGGAATIFVESVLPAADQPDAEAKLHELHATCAPTPG